MGKPVNVGDYLRRRYPERYEKKNELKENKVIQVEDVTKEKLKKKKKTTSVIVEEDKKTKEKEDKVEPDKKEK